MKTLYLVRHAKSSWKNPDLSDFERPLNKRGERDAPFMGKLMKEKGLKPDLIISSPAKRALITAKAIAEKLHYPVEKIVEEDRLYDNTVRELMKVIHGVDNKVDYLMLIGHNPSFTETANLLCDYSVDNIPTCAVFAIDFDMEGWSQLKTATGEFKFFEYPKKYKEQSYNE